MKGLLAWIVFAFAAACCLLWIGFGVRDDLREDDVFHNVIKERVDLAGESGGEIYVGVAGDWKEHGDVLHGVELAADEINGDGGILGRKVVLVPHDDHGTVEGALAVAQEFASRPEIPFVIGHTHLPLNGAVAQNYEFYGVLVMSPNTSGLGATANAFSLIFEDGMPPAQTSGAILALARDKGWKRVGLIYAKSDHATRQAREFESMANQHGIQVVLSFGYEGRGSGVAQHMARWKRELDLDAMVLTVHEENVIPLISACRVIGLDCPFVVTGERPDGIARAEGLGNVYFLEPVRNGQGYERFAARFKAKFGHAPTSDGALGYDALRLYADAVREAETFVPAEVADALEGDVTESLSGTLLFDGHGSAVKRAPLFRPY
jgi:branched-chain amino acid transport system substrate-binding protein